jgi:O-antigen/teichoic acid export membrane protein
MILDMVGASEAGIYGLAYSISQIMTILNGALSQTLEPWFYKKIKQRDLESMGNVTYLSVGMIAAANLIVIAFAPEVVAIFAPPEYQEGIWVVPPVTMSVYFMVFLSIFGPFEFYFEKTKMIAAATVVGAAMNIILNLLLIPRFGS